MGNINFVTGLMKILENPKQIISKDKIQMISCRAQFPEKRKTSLVYLKFWGKLGRDILSYYKMNDYVLIEGQISLNYKENSKKLKKIEINVLRIYPHILNANLASIDSSSVDSPSVDSSNVNPSNVDSSGVKFSLMNPPEDSIFD